MIIDDIVKIRRMVKSGEPNPNSGVVVKNLDKKINEFINSNEYKLDNIEIYTHQDYKNGVENLSINLINCIGRVIGFDNEYFTVKLNSMGKELLKEEISKYKIGAVILTKYGNYSKCEKVIKFILYER